MPASCLFGSRPKPERDKIKTCGYVAPRPTMEPPAGSNGSSNTCSNLQVGKVHIEGQENIDKVDGPRSSPVQSPPLVKIAREAARRSGKPVYLVPSYLRYGKYPGAWLSSLDRAVQYFVVLLLFPLYRRQARLVVGKAWSTDEMVDSTGQPLTDEEATKIFRDKVVALDPGKV
ncbi:MAG: hypothetical protein IPI39_25615 [Candidatus Obscuribacter sp.]|nr:hypothetical protein [Candidatus Obscuribacter sp.]